MYLRQSTSQVVRFGPFLDSTDGVTAETALTIAQADMQLSKDGGAFAQKSAAGNATHDTDGWYSTTLSTTDTATVGELLLQVNVSGSVPVWVRWWVLEEVIYDALYGASADGFDANGRVDVGAWLGNAVTHGTGGPDVNVNAISDDTTAAINLEADYDGTGFAKANSTIGTCTTNTDMRGTDSAATAAALATVDANVDAILVDTGTTLPATLATIDGNVDAVLVDTGTTIPAQITALNDVSAADILGATVTEGYSTAGGAVTLAQILHEIRQTAADFSISGTTLTVKRADGTTTAMTFTLDDADAPTSRTRAT